MSLYTKTGDRGITSLYGGRRVLKSDTVVETYGSLDELSSFIGLTGLKLAKTDRLLLTSIQKDLYQIMSFLAGAKVNLKFIDQRVIFFEKTIDQIENRLPKLGRFIIPTGHEASGWLQLSRTVCRRAERNIVRFASGLASSLQPPASTIKYLNRLSDLFFVMARKYNRDKEVLV